MNPATRACVAYAALRLISGQRAPAVYDHARSLYVSINGAVSDTNMSLFDFSRSTHFAGSGNNGEFSLYDFDRSCLIDLKIKDRQYEGFDHCSAKRFSGSVEGTSTSIEVHGNLGRFDYSL